MGYYSDPTANHALGSINREFSRLTKKARRLRDRWEKGTLSPDALDRAQESYTGIYRHVLINVFKEPRESQLSDKTD